MKTKNGQGTFIDFAGRRRPKAVIFTHLGSLSYDLYSKLGKRELINQYKDMFINYLKCNLDKERIAIVYAYVDWALKETLNSLKGKHFTKVPADVVTKEKILIDILKHARSEARISLGLPETSRPRFHFIGLEDLLQLMENLAKVDDRLLHLLHGPNNVFTYDAPKIVDSIIRLARGGIPHLSIHPVIRFDSDVIPNGKAIDYLIDEYQKQCRQGPFFFFSGVYGNYTHTYDPINDHAVRVHWFIKSKAADEPAKKVIRMFLSDLNELGAFQIQGAGINDFSSGMKLILNKRSSISGNKYVTQVISGAGLIMPGRAVGLLPPFMSSKNFMVWIDDYHKRYFHEVLKHMDARDEIESVANAKFLQSREDRTEKWTREDYLPRLLRGCMFTRVIANLDGTPTYFSELVSDLITFKILNIKFINKTHLEHEIKKAARERISEVLGCWKSIEYKGYLSYDWAIHIDRHTDLKNKFIQEVWEDSWRYIELLLKWPIFVRAIERLPFIGHSWLFEPID